ncbi:MAG: c-type cytochrome [Cocleimonas sp.]|nr:c-type cytochrome [Cocleimonas sp.]
MKKIIQSLLAVFFIFYSDFLLADEVTLNGASLIKQHCAECHGEQGNGIGSTVDKKEGIPKIAGFSAILIFDILDQFKSNEREALDVMNKNKQLTNMIKISKNLSGEKLEAISLYLSEQTFLQSNNTTSTNKGLVVQGKQLHEDLCNDCHIKNGTSAADDAPILAGQNRQYLIRQFKQLSTSKRYIPKRMKRKFRKLSEKDKEALIEYYTSAP